MEIRREIHEEAGKTFSEILTFHGLSAYKRPNIRWKPTDKPLSEGSMLHVEQNSARLHFRGPVPERPQTPYRFPSPGVQGYDFIDLVPAT